MSLVLQHLLDWLILAKYRITAVAVFTGYAAIIVHGTHATDAALVVPCLAALFLLGASANTLNQIFERDKDAAMNRTRHRRPIPAGRVGVREAAIVAGVEFALCEWLLVVHIGSWVAGGLALATLLYYSFYYTLYLKPRGPMNIVVGGVPGAMGPLIAWAAASGGVDAAPLAMFALIFLWTPPHVWALAIRLKDDYARAGIPMLPVVRGEDETTRQIFRYTVVMVAFSLTLPLLTPFAWDGIYMVLAVVLGAVFLGWTWILWRHRPILPTMPLFRYSIIYIGLLFVGMIAETVVTRGMKGSL